MLSSDNKEFFLSLVRLGIGTGTVSSFKFQDSIDWNALEDLAARQGLSAVVVDGVDKLPLESRPPKPMLLQWIGETLQGYEYRYGQYCKAIAEMASFYNKHGFRMMVLKGYACSLDWPKPEHRPTGDIDIWQFGKQKEADAVLVKEKGIKIDKSHHHHTVFDWCDFMVENHYDFNNVHHHKSNASLEKIFKELGKDDSHTVDVLGQIVYLPSPNLHALFLLKHSMTDFSAFFVTLRQVLDWAFFVNAHTKEIDWDWLIGVMEQYHMAEFFNTINSICVEDLGFDSRIFPYVQYNPFLKDKVLNDILSPKFPRKEPRGLITRLVFKYRRWKGNTWKHEMCYNETLWSGFWSGIWNHLLKPSSI